MTVGFGEGLGVREGESKVKIGNLSSDENAPTTSRDTFAQKFIKSPALSDLSAQRHR